jgi:hypothetical protein
LRRRQWLVDGDEFTVDFIDMGSAAGAGQALAQQCHHFAVFAPALALSWGLAWVAVGRLTAEPSSTITGVAAIVAIVVLLITKLPAMLA